MQLLHVVPLDAIQYFIFASLIVLVLTALHTPHNNRKVILQQNQSCAAQVLKESFLVTGFKYIITYILSTCPNKFTLNGTISHPCLKISLIPFLNHVFLSHVVELNYICPTERDLLSVRHRDTGCW